MKCRATCVLGLLLVMAAFVWGDNPQADRENAPPSQVQGDLKISLESIARERVLGAGLEDEEDWVPEGPILTVRLAVEDLKHRDFDRRYRVTDATLTTSGGFSSTDFSINQMPFLSFTDRSIRSALAPLVSSLTGARGEDEIVLANAKNFSDEQVRALAERMASTYAKVRTARADAAEALHACPWYRSLVVRADPCPATGTPFDVRVEVDEPEPKATAFVFSKLKPGMAGMHQTQAGMTVTIEKVERFRFQSVDVFAIRVVMEGGDADVEWAVARIVDDRTRKADQMPFGWRELRREEPAHGLALGVVDTAARSVEMDLTATRRAARKPVAFEFKGLTVP